MSSLEFAEELAMEQIDPGEPIRSDLRAAMIACTIANAFRGEKTKAIPLDSFLLNFKTKKELPKYEEVRMKLDIWKSSMNRKSRRERKSKKCQ